MGYDPLGGVLDKKMLIDVENEGIKRKGDFIFRNISLWWSIRVAYAEEKNHPSGHIQLIERFFSILIKYIYSFKKNDFAAEENANRHPDIICIEGMRAIIKKNNRYEDNVVESIHNCLEKRGFFIEMLFPPVPSNKLKKFRKIMPSLKYKPYILPINPYRFKEKKTFSLNFRSTYVLSTTYSEAKSAFHSYMEIFKRKRPKAILIYNEAGALRYPAVVAAKKLGIPVIAIQHGIIYEGHPYYFHIPANIAGEGDYINFVLPDKTCVYGNYEKNLLKTYGSFPAEKIVVTGAPRYDSLFKKISKQNDDVFRRYRIPRGKKYLLWATQTHDKIMSSSGENIVNAEAVFSQMSSMEGWYLIIKLHPGEDQKAKLYRKMSKKYGLKVTIIGRDADLYDILKVVDAVIIKNSTVGMEAIFAGKPVLLLNIVKSHSLMTYTDYGFDLIVERAEDIKNILNRLNDKEFQKEFQKKREYFMHERCANVGKATESVCEIVERAINKKKV